MLAILSGGVVAYPRMLAASKGTLVAAAATVVAAGTLAFSSWGSIHNRDTYVQDHLLLANAHAETDQDLEAARWAYTVLWDHPDRREAQRIYTVSYFNLQLMQDPGVKLFGNWDSQRQWIVQSPPTDPVQDVILGVFFWQWGRQDQAAVIWNSIMANGGPGANLATACLAATGRGQPVKPESANLQEAVARLLRDSHPESQN
jgi:hypothetical protein